MEVPEKLALIGGSILLSSTLIFTLKSQASNIIPSVGHSISKIYSHISDGQRSMDFDSGYQQAQRNGWQTGTWGTTKYYVDDNEDMYIGGGILKDGASPTIDTSAIQSITLTKNVQLPDNISWMFSNYPNLQTINGLGNADASKVTNVSYLFWNDSSLRRVDLSGWHTSPLTSSRDMLWDDCSLTDANLSGLNIPKGSDDYYYFMKVDSLHSITLGERTRLHSKPGFREGTWQNGSQILNSDQLINGDSHPGTWLHQ